jgi:hypothetical protein
MVAMRTEVEGRVCWFFMAGIKTPEENILEDKRCILSHGFSSWYTAPLLLAYGEAEHHGGAGRWSRADYLMAGRKQ